MTSERMQACDAQCSPVCAAATDSSAAWDWIDGCVALGVTAERRRYERRSAADRRVPSDRRRVEPAVQAVSDTVLDLGSAEGALLRCRRCGSHRLDRSHRRRVERFVTWLVGRKAFRCRLCGWRGWLAG